MGPSNLAVANEKQTAPRTAATTANGAVRLTLCAALGLAAAAIGTSGVAAPSADAAAEPAAVDAGQICRDTVGLASAGRSFGECVDALSQSAASLRRAAATRSALEQCRGQAYRQGGGALVKCEVGATDAAAPLEARTEEARAMLGGKPPVTSYFNLSWREAHQRRAMACAALGYSPESAGFSTCVAGLQAALLRADHPFN
jgi:hypothetical protein